MNLLNKLTIKNLKLNKKRTIVTIIGIMLSVALITAVSTMYSSALKSLLKYERDEQGDFHVVIKDVSAKDKTKILADAAVKSIVETKGLGYARLEESKNDYKPYAYVMSFDKEALSTLKVKLVKGRMPENDSEILIPTHLKSNGRVELQVGDEITLNVGHRYIISKDHGNEEVFQSCPYQEGDLEVIENTEPRTYKIVGVCERPTYSVEDYTAPGYTFITTGSPDANESGVSNIYLKFNTKTVKDTYKAIGRVLGVDEELFYKGYTGEFEDSEYERVEEELLKIQYLIDVNIYLIRLEFDPLGLDSSGGLAGVALVVCGIIVVTSVFCIKNSFDISITEKIKQYGMLRSIGATKKQIKKNVYYEAGILGLIGIPLGLLSGIIASNVLIAICNLLLKDMMGEGLTLIIGYAWWAILLSVLLGLVTIYFSAFYSARLASRVSPIESIRNSGGIRIKTKKISSPKIVRKIFGMGGEISYKNIKRNKKKYRTTIISVAVSVTVFIALSYFMSLAFDAVRSEYKTSDYNIEVSVEYNGFTKAYEAFDKISKLENIENYSIVDDGVFPIKGQKLSKEFIDYYHKTERMDENGKVYSLKDMTEEEILNDEYGLYWLNQLLFVCIGDDQYEKYITELGLKYDNVKDKGILVDNQDVTWEENGKSVKRRIPFYGYRAGDIVNFTAPIYSDDKVSWEEGKVKIAEVTDKRPFGLSNRNYTDNPILIVSDEFLRKEFELTGEKYGHPAMYIKSDDASKLQDEIEKIINDEFNIFNTEEQVKQMESFYLLIAIFLYGFITVISLIGVTNVFNTISTSINLRRREFAMLESIGMTSKEFKRMIRLESLFVGLKALVFSLPIGIAITVVMYYELGKDLGINYILPWKPILGAVVVVMLLIWGIMRYSVGIIGKQNTIETIRNENI